MGKFNTVPIQIVNTQVGTLATGTTATPYDDTIPAITEGDQYMSRTITPTSATNILKIDVVAFFTNSLAQGTTVALHNGGAAVAAGAVLPSSTNEPQCVKFTHFMTAGDTTVLTFTVRIGGNGGGTISFNGYTGGQKMGGVMASSITITEVAA